MMIITDLERYFHNPALLNDATLSQIKELVGVYPACQFFRFLYVKNLLNVNHPDFINELNKAAIYATDRRQLFFILYSDTQGWTQVYKAISESRRTEASLLKQTDAFSLIDDFLSTRNDDMTQEEMNNLMPAYTSTSDYVSLIKTDEKEQQNVEIQFEHGDLIDSFIEKTEHSNIKLIDSDQEYADIPSVLKAEEGLQDDAFFTESLAKIYIKQKRYAKALEIIRKLNLKYPEKNAYFADQIQFLEKLIINTKN